MPWSCRKRQPSPDLPRRGKRLKASIAFVVPSPHASARCTRPSIANSKHPATRREPLRTCPLPSRTRRSECAAWQLSSRPFSQICRSHAQRHGVKSGVASQCDAVRAYEQHVSKGSWIAFEATIQAGEWTQVCRSLLTILTAGERCALNRNLVACSRAALHRMILATAASQVIYTSR